MKKYVFLIATATLMGTSACNNATSNSTDENMASQPEESVIVEETEEIITEVNHDEEVKKIDAVRETIEGKMESIKPVEISTAGLREQIKQKWSKIHFYMDADKVLRIKTYPHDAISKRTEEFYFDNGRLVLAVIEDDGDGATKGREASEMSKLYYFQNGELIHEVNNAHEEEHTIRQSDAERLQTEADEYIEILENNQSN